MPHIHSSVFTLSCETLCYFYDKVTVGGDAASLWGREKSVVMTTAEVRGTWEKTGGPRRAHPNGSEVKTGAACGPVLSTAPGTVVRGVCGPGTWPGEKGGALQLPQSEWVEGPLVWTWNL